MIQTHSDDPDVVAAADEAFTIIQNVLNNLPPATSYDYGGQQLRLGEYEVCQTCTKAIAEAQQAQNSLEAAADACQDETITEHITKVATLFASEAHAAMLRAELHNGFGTEKMLNLVNGFIYDRSIHDQFEHNHEQGNA